MKKRIIKKLLDILKLIGIALGIVALLTGIGWYIVTADLREIERKNKADPIYQEVMAKKAEQDKIDKEKQKKLDENEKKKQKEEKSIADFEKSIKGKYTKEYLRRIAASDKKMAEHLVKIGKYDCMAYFFTSHDWDDDLCYDELSYYVFKNERSAKKAFKYIKENWIGSETDSAKNYVQGWEKDVLDASVEIFVYQIDNMIITAELQVVSGWTEPEYGEDYDPAVSFYYRKSFILDNF